MNKLLLLTALAGLAWTAAGSAQAPRPVTVLKFAFDMDSPPYSWEDEKGALHGLFPEIVKLVLAELPDYSPQLTGYPWARAQQMLVDGEEDGFLTYPSQSRKGYALFTQKPLFTEDIGYLVFSRTNPRAEVLARVKTLEGLKAFQLLVAKGSDWEQDNVPAFLPRQEIVSNRSRIGLLIKRHFGDYTIMGLEEARWQAERENCLDQIAWARTALFNDTTVDFHLGLRKSLGGASGLMTRIETVLKTPAFQLKLKKLLASYSLGKN